MVFNSIEFICYFPIVFILYWFVFSKRSIPLRNWFLVVTSYIFYGWWDVRFLCLIIFTSLYSYLAGRGIQRWYDGNSISGKRFNVAKAINISNIIVNLGILFVFKYYNFFVSQLLSKVWFFENDPILTFIILPVGISFYTFQAISYSIDVYRQDMEACRDMSSYFAYIAFFPQLVAGPIERAKKLLPQFYSQHNFNPTIASDGCRQILWGFFKKIVVADTCGEFVDNIFSNYGTLPSGTLILGTFLFSIQIYCDFSGYSDIAIGSARLFGINLSQNFKFPYFTKNIADFWRRWHISLTTWFKDYLYIPLGGNRNGIWIWIRNILIVFLLSGLWHGANWTFILWGLLNAIFMITYVIYYNKKRNRANKNALVKEKNRFFAITAALNMMLIFILVSFGRIFFRSESVEKAFGYINNIFSKPFIDSPMIPGGWKILLVKCLVPIAFLLGVEWYHRNRDHGFDISHITSRSLRWGLYYLLVIMILFYYFDVSSSVESFIYFQF